MNGPLKGLLVQQARQSASQREVLQEGLTIEERSLEAAESVVDPIQKFLGEVRTAALDEVPMSRLASLASEAQTYRCQCQGFLKARQEEIHTVNRRVNGDSKTLTQEYLYRDLSVTFPVLATATDCHEALEEASIHIGKAVRRRN